MVRVVSHRCRQCGADNPKITQPSFVNPLELGYCGFCGTLGHGMIPILVITVNVARDGKGEEFT